MAILDPVLGWTLAFHPFIGVLILSLIVTLIINIITKFTTNQSEMKRLKTEIDGYRKKMKEARDNPKKMMKLNSEAMDVNMQYMKHSFRAMLFTFIPIIFIFGWMNANYMYAPLAENEPLLVHAEFLEGFEGVATITSTTLLGEANATITTVDEKQLATFAVTGPKGVHNATIHYQQFEYPFTVTLGEKPKTSVFAGKGPVEQINVAYPRIRPLGSFHLGGWHPGWLAIYIVLSIILSIGTRKVMKIY